jgi:acetylornithine deacetylase/succinyl-diaminopimelate desuccinylase-like protein
MKAGIAAAMITLDLLWRHRDVLCGELVLVLAGDEETGGTWGTQYLLDHVPQARGDAMISGDAGSPRVARFGEKGQMWLELRARGRSAHGAHVHLGVNAIERLMEAVGRLLRLRSLPVEVLPAIAEAISRASEISEPLSGAGESDVLRKVTVNVGTITGGGAVNIIPDVATAHLDIRFPPGVGTAEILAQVKAAIAGLDGVDVDVLSCCEPNWTDPEHEIVRRVLEHAANAVGRPVVANMRIGFSDARFYRLAGIPAVVYGPTPYNMGGPDEYVEIADAEAMMYVHALAAFDYLVEG